MTLYRRKSPAKAVQWNGPDNTAAVKAILPEGWTVREFERFLELENQIPKFWYAHFGWWVVAEEDVEERRVLVLEPKEFQELFEATP